MVKVLELFSGTHSVGKECHKRGWHVTSLDRDLPGYDKLDKDKKYNSDKHFQEDILTWDYKQYKVGHFDLITASPVCLYWSALRYTWIGRKMKDKDTGELKKEPFTKQELLDDIEKYGKPMVDKIREIIDYLKPKFFWIENPNSSSMKKYINDLPFVIADYCKYSDWGYKKRTRFWVSQSIKDKFKPKLCKNDCDNIITIKTQEGDIHSGYGCKIKGKTRTLHTSNIGGSKKKKSMKQAVANGEVIKKRKKRNLHKVSMGSWGKSGTTQTGVGGGNNRLERYRIPPSLINDLLDCLTFTQEGDCVLLKGDCLKIMKTLPDKSIDIFIQDLPYGQISAKWDCKIDLKQMWQQFQRIKKSKNTPFFFFTTTKFGYELISSMRKFFRYDLLWIKSSAVGFLNARRMPMRKTEMVYVFYEKLPFYDLSSHKHKYLKSNRKTDNKDLYNVNNKYKENYRKYTPPVPNNCIYEKSDKGGLYGKSCNYALKKRDQPVYNPPLPTNVIDNGIIGDDNVYRKKGDKPLKRSGYDMYEPKLPTNVIDKGMITGGEDGIIYNNSNPLYRADTNLYEPQLPTNVIDENKKYTYKQDGKDVYGFDKRKEVRFGKDVGKSSIYEPALPTNVIEETKSKRGIYGGKSPVVNLGNSYCPKLPNNIINERQYNKDVVTEGNNTYNNFSYFNNGKTGYNPPLHTNVMNTIYGEIKEKTAVVKKRGKDRKSNYEPSLPTNVVIEDLDMYGMNREEYDKRPKNERGQQYEPPLPTNILNYKSVRGLHQTQKPVELIKWILKYYSKEGWTCLDCCMGSASTGQACKEMNRKFIGIELDDKIFNIAQTRLKGTADQLKELCKKPKRKKKINTEKVLVI